jgi:hypothetical protein
MTRLADPPLTLEAYIQERAMTDFYKPRQVYIGKSLNGEVFVEAEVCGHSRIITLKCQKDAISFTMHMGECEAQQLGNMLIGAAAETRAPWPHRSPELSNGERQ